MKSLSTEQLNLIAGLGFILVIILSVLAIHFYKKFKNAAADASEEARNDIKRLTAGLDSKQAELNKMDIELSKLKSDFSLLKAAHDSIRLENSELEGKLEILKSENNKLLKAAADDITVNIKTETANVPVERKKRPYFKRKNAGSTSSNPKMGKRK